MALYQSKGRISEMSEVQSGTTQSGTGWQRMTLVLEIPGFQGSVTKQAFQVSGDKVNDVLLLNIGDQVIVSWSLYAREWNGKWYNNVDLVKIQPADEASHEHRQEAAPATRVKAEAKPEEENGDLPF